LDNLPGQTPVSLHFGSRMGNAGHNLKKECHFNQEIAWYAAISLKT
jgi:hypothetical protein